MLLIRFAAVLAFLVCTLSHSHSAELPAKWTATVTLEKIEIRAAPAWASPQTMVLKKGQQVAIYRDEGQFYEILPPEGSVSWVNHLFLGEFDPKAQGKRNAVIKKPNECAIRVGSELELPSEGKDPSYVTDICQIKLPYGSIVELRGPKYFSNNSYWYPITPPVGEFRYIAKGAVGNVQPVNAPTSSAKPNPSGVVIGGPETTVSNPPTNPNPVNPIPGAKVAHPLWGEAELLQSQGRYVEAGKVYLQIYQELKEKRAELEDLLTCLNRIVECDDKAKSRNGNLNVSREAPPRNPPTATLENPSNPRPQPPPPTGRKDWPTSRIEERVETKSPNESEGNLKSTGPGVLRRAPFLLDNKQVYALHSNNGELLYYVTAQRDVNLDPLISKRVELLGTVQARGDLRSAYMVVTKANTPK